MLRDRGEAAEETDKKGGRVEKLFTDLESTDMRDQSGDSESTNMPQISLHLGIYLFSPYMLTLWDYHMPLRYEKHFDFLFV